MCSLAPSLTDPEALSDKCISPLPVLRDQRGVVALLAGILTLTLQADPLADERSDDHLEALPCGGALRAPHQPVNAQPDDKQMGDQRGHPGILHCPPQRPGDIKSQAGGFRSSSKAPALLIEADFDVSCGGKKRVIPAVFS